MTSSDLKPFQDHAFTFSSRAIRLSHLKRNRYTKDRTTDYMLRSSDNSLDRTSVTALDSFSSSCLSPIVPPTTGRGLYDAASSAFPAPSLADCEDASLLQQFRKSHKPNPNSSGTITHCWQCSDLRLYHSGPVAIPLADIRTSYLNVEYCVAVDCNSV